MGSNSVDSNGKNEMLSFLQQPAMLYGTLWVSSSDFAKKSVMKKIKFLNENEPQQFQFASNKAHHN